MDLVSVLPHKEGPKSLSDRWHCASVRIYPRPEHDSVSLQTNKKDVSLSTTITAVIHGLGLPERSHTQLSSYMPDCPSLVRPASSSVA